MSGHQVAGNTAGDEEGWPRHAPERGEWCTVETRGFEPRPLRATARSSGGHVPLIGRNEVIARNRLLVRAPCPLLRGEYLPTPLGVAGSNEDRLSSPHPTLSPRERSKRIEAPGGASSTTLVETAGFEPPTVGRYAPSSGGHVPLIARNVDVRNHEVSFVLAAPHYLGRCLPRPHGSGVQIPDRSVNGRFVNRR